MMTMILSRRRTLLGLTTILSGAGARLAVAAADTDRRLVVVLLRGALDGMAAVTPYGDPHIKDLRAPLVLPEPGQTGGLLDLGGFYGMHPALSGLHGLYTRGELAVVHAVAGPYRARSHFVAQDIMESGADRRLTSGWLNRALGATPARAQARRSRDAMAIGGSVPLLLRGDAPVENWAPSGIPTPQADLYTTIAALNAADPLLGPAMKAGLDSRGFSRTTLPDNEATAARTNFQSLAGSAGRLLAAANGPRIAALEIGSWDTHSSQVPRLKPLLEQLDAGLVAMRDALGPAWKTTAVLVMTEFGRAVRINGSAGTDHGTGAAAFVLGGAVAGGRVIADWPGLAPGKLFEDRDLMPTTDLRAISMALVAEQLGVPAAALRTVFPGSDAVAPTRGLLRT